MGMTADCRGLYCDNGSIIARAGTDCVQHAECVEIPTDPFYQCACEQGYVGDGQLICELDACELDRVRQSMN